MIFLAAEPGRKGPPLAASVRERAATVGRWLTRDRAEGLNGLHEVPRPGRPSAGTRAYRTGLRAAGRRRPRSVGVPFALWTLPRLGDDRVEPTGRRGSAETVRRALRRVGSVLSPPQPQLSSPAPDDQAKTSRGQRAVTICSPGMCLPRRTQ